VRSVCLMYHDVHEGAAPVAGIPRTAALYHVSKNAFREHLRVVAATGTAVRTVGEHAAGAEGDSVVLTFDDGWAGSLSTGVECLLAAGLRATFFVTRDFCGRPGFADASLLREAHAAGMEPGTHGATHRFLGRLPEAELRDELTSSKAFLEDLLGAAVTTGSVPGGDWSPEVARIARECGYTALCTSQPGVNDERTDPLALRRVAIRRATPLAAVERYARFRVGREVVRASALGVPRRLVGPHRYAALRARLLRT
jgi:peptidoglycan/xylan/chitin deacetylase (PgdA/CDA1 family)